MDFIERVYVFVCNLQGSLVGFKRIFMLKFEIYIYNFQNLSKPELQALKDLQNRNDIIITNADKGGAVVIMDVSEYLKEANRQLNDTNTYKKLDQDPTNTHVAKINNTTEVFKTEGLISEKVSEGLKTHDTKTPKFSLLPKIHKVNIPGRPLVDSSNCHSTNISKYVDHHLQPSVKNLKSYVKDFTDVLNKLSNINHKVTKIDILVTMDVRSIYTSIPHKEGVDAVRNTMNSFNPSKSRIITAFLFLILTLNNFIFNGLNYIQKIGCAIGTKCAPTYANIFVGQFEEKYIYPKVLKKTRIFSVISMIYFLSGMVP